MTPAEFKSGLREISKNLKGVTLQFVTKHSVKPYQKLRDFRLAILEQEKYGNSFSVNMVWTTNGTININSMKHLAQLFSKEKITGIQFRSYYQPKDFSEALRDGFTLND